MPGFFAPEHRSSADISVSVRMININKGHNQSLMERCPPLNEYAWSVDSVRQYKKTDNLETAIDRTLDSMPDSFQIKSFLEQHRAEVKNMLLTEYNEAETLEMFKRDYLAEGRAKGRAEGRAKGRAEGRAKGRAEGAEAERLNSIRSIMDALKEIPHNARGPLAGEYQPLAACKNLDYPPGNLRFLQFAID